MFIKCEHLNPGGSVKDRTARAIVLDAEARGLLQARATTMIEGTAGNTGVGLALLARARGYRLICVLPEKMAVDKRIALRQLGSEVIITKNGPLDRAAQLPQRRRAARRGERLVPDQPVPQPGEPRARTTARRQYRGTGQEILEQMRRPATTRSARSCARRAPAARSPASARASRSTIRASQVVLADPVGCVDRRAGSTPATLGPDGPFAVEGIGSGSVPGNLHRDVARLAPRRSATPRRSRWSSASSRKRASPSAARPASTSSPRCASPQRGDLAGPVVTIAADQWDRYNSTAWMKAWMEREAATITLPT